MLTLQIVEVGTKEGRAFLRKVQKHNLDSSMDESWRIYAAESTGWKMQFRRTIKGETGEPDESIEVQTDFEISRPDRHRTGSTQSYAVDKPVYICTPRAVHFTGSDTALVAKFILDGWRFALHASCGSANTSEIGLAFYWVGASLPGWSWSEVAIGGKSLTQNGRCICSSAVDVM